MVRFLPIIFAGAAFYSGPQNEIFRAESAAPVFSGRPVLPRLRSSSGRFMTLRFSGKNPDGPDGRRLRSVEGADILNSAKSQDRLSASFCMRIRGFLRYTLPAAERQSQIKDNKYKTMGRGRYFFKNNCINYLTRRDISITNPIN